MSGEPWITARLWFKKTGRARYISHLDLNRCMARAMHKAHIPLWYTEGFNPHPFLTFALPLSLGIDGVRESMDIRLTEEMDTKELLDSVNAGLPPDIRLFDRTEPKMKPGKIAYAGFEFALEPEQGTAQDVREALEALLSQETIFVKKKSKSGIKEIDIKPFLDIRDLREEDGKLRFFAMLPAGSTQNVNPHLLLDALQNDQNCAVYASITRVDLYDSEGERFE